MGIHLGDNRFVRALRLSQRAFGDYRKQIMALTAFGFLSGILEGIGVNALIPLFSFALNGGGQGTDFISRTIEKFFNFFGLNLSVSYLLVFIVILFILKAIVVLYLNVLKAKITSDYEAKTQSNLLKHVLASRWEYLLRQKLGHLENIINTDVKQSGVLLQQISNAIMVATSLLVYTIVAINISFVFTLATLAVGGVIFFVFKKHLFITKRIGHDRTSTNKMIAHYINENVVGIKTVKTMGVTKPILDKANLFFNKLKELSIEETWRKTITTAFIQPIGVIFICFIFAITYTSSTFNLAVLVAIVYLIQRIFTYLQQLQRGMQSAMTLIPHLQSVVDYQQIASEQKENVDQAKPFIFKKSIVFDHVTFSYRQDTPVLKGISFKVNKGEMIGIVGPSGAGKTTLVDLLLRLFQLDQGRILLDGVDANDIDLVQWRSKIGYVSQDMFLMNDTIANNIRFYNQALSQKEIEAAAKQAQIHDFVQTLPEKYDSIIGDRGVLLSGGQRQRVVIARVLAQKPDVLVLDEATSALDNESEVKIQEVIRNLRGKVTVLVIAHRLSTIMDSDQLLILTDGKVSEQGLPKTLLKDKESYFSKVYNIRNN